MRFLFIGERPSNKALEMGVTWKDGRLAAKQLFDALIANNIDPHSQRFDNVFHQDESVSANAIGRIRQAHRRGLRLVAMGQKVAKVLCQRALPCLTIVHPAARGHIRKKERYADHVRQRLNSHDSQG